MSRVAAQSGPRFRVLGSTAAYLVHGLDSQEPLLKAGVLPTDDGYGVEPESAWGMLGIDGSADDPLTPVQTERGDYPAFYAGLADSILHGAPLPVGPHESLAVLKILARARELSGLSN